MWPQSGEGPPGGIVSAYGVPGPAHATSPPSPVDHDTDVGRAVAVTDTPPADADLDCARHTERSTHSHVGRVTNWSSSGFGDDLMTGLGNTRSAVARRARAAGEGAAAPPPGPVKTAQRCPAGSVDGAGHNGRPPRAATERGRETPLEPLRPASR